MTKDFFNGLWPGLMWFANSFSIISSLILEGLVIVSILMVENTPWIIQIINDTNNIPMDDLSGWFPKYINCSNNKGISWRIDLKIDTNTFYGISIYNIMVFCTDHFSKRLVMIFI